MHQLQRSWVRSQHPSAQWNLRGGRWSSVEYSTKKKLKNPPKYIKQKNKKETDLKWKMPAYSSLKLWSSGTTLARTRLFIAMFAMAASSQQSPSSPWSIKKGNVLHWRLSIIMRFSLTSTITNNQWQIIYDDISVIDISQFNSQRTGKPFGHSSK